MKDFDDVLESPAISFHDKTVYFSLKMLLENV